MPNPEDRMELKQLGDRVYAAERILQKKIVKKGKILYLVKWKGWNSAHNTWEPEANILDSRLVEAFESSLKSNTTSTPGGGAKRGPKPKNKKTSSPVISKNEVSENYKEESQGESDDGNDSDTEAKYENRDASNQKKPHKSKKLKRKHKDRGTTSEKLSIVTCVPIVNEEEHYTKPEPVQKNSLEEHCPIPAQFWLKRQPIADHVVITDVTVDFMTVTIRECPNKLGFFKE